MNKHYDEYTIIEDGPDCYPWIKTFFLFPHKTITGKWIWWKYGYMRKVYIVEGMGFHMEPEVQYADLFDILTDGN